MVNSVKKILFLIIVSLLLINADNKVNDKITTDTKVNKVEVKQVGAGKKVYLIPISGEIDSALPFYVRRGMVAAKEAGADAVVIEITTLGGLVNAALLIRDELIESPVKTYALIHRAISAGALISLSCDELYMFQGGAIGDALPIQIGMPAGPPDASKVSTNQKIIDYLRTEFRTTAERKHHPTDLAEGMVDPEIEIKGLKKKGNILTLTSQQALQYKLVNSVVASREDFLDQIGYRDATIVETKLTSSEKFARAITNLNFSWILLLIGILAIVAEFKAPGFGLPGTVGIIALGLFFWGSYIAQLSGWFEIILFLVGISLLLIEIFIIPGFGIVGVAGILLILVSVFLAMFKSPPSGFEFGWWRLEAPIRNMAIILLASLIVIYFIIKELPKSFLWKRVALSRELSSKEGYISSDDIKQLIGKLGTTQTLMRPAGIVEVEGKRIDAMTAGDFIQPGTTIKVIDIAGSQIVVERYNS